MRKDFGIWEHKINQTIADSYMFGCKKAAGLNSVGVRTVYAWRKYQRENERIDQDYEQGR